MLQTTILIYIAMHIFGTLYSIFQVQCFPLYSVLAALGNPRVDYFSLDVEGAEYPILKTIPWDKVNLNLLGIEVPHLGKVFPGSLIELKSMLSFGGYREIGSAGHDIFFAKYIV